MGSLYLVISGKTQDGTMAYKLYEVRETRDKKNKVTVKKPIAGSYFSFYRGQHVHIPQPRERLTRSLHDNIKDAALHMLNSIYIHGFADKDQADVRPTALFDFIFKEKNTGIKDFEKTVRKLKEILEK